MTAPTHDWIAWSSQDEDNGEPYPGQAPQLDFRINSPGGGSAGYTDDTTEAAFAAASMPTFDATPTHHSPVDPWYISVGGVAGTGGGWTAQLTTAQPTNAAYAEPQIAGLTAV